MNVFVLISLPNQNSLQIDTRPVANSSGITRQLTILENRLKTQTQLYNVLKLQMQGINYRFLKLQQRKVNKQGSFNETDFKLPDFRESSYSESSFSDSSSSTNAKFPPNEFTTPENTSILRHRTKKFYWNEILKNFININIFSFH